jgi:hypothetical protein
VEYAKVPDVVEGRVLPATATLALPWLPLPLLSLTSAAVPFHDNSSIRQEPKSTGEEPQALAGVELGTQVPDTVLPEFT